MLNRNIWGPFVLQLDTFALGLEAPARSNCYRNPGFLCAHVWARYHGEEVEEVAGSWVVRGRQGHFLDKRTSPGKCFQKSPNFPPAGGKQVGSGGMRPPGRDFVELLTQLQNLTPGRRPGDFWWCVDKTLNHTGSHREDVTSLLISVFPPFFSVGTWLHRTEVFTVLSSAHDTILVFMDHFII